MGPQSVSADMFQFTLLLISNESLAGGNDLVLRFPLKIWGRATVKV
jgi:hypothetical protein